MSKKETLAKVLVVAEEYGFPEDAIAKLAEIVGPKTGRTRGDINEVACFDDEGNPVFILDTIFNVWLPVVNSEGEPNFYSKEGKLGYTRNSKAGELIKSQRRRAFEATKTSTLDALLDGSITQDEAKNLIAEAAEIRDAVISVPDDIEYSTDKPC